MYRDTVFPSMPWTPAHPAFTIPFLKVFRHPFPATCLVIGSMAPDMPYFFLVRFVGFGHAFPFAYVLGVPLTIVLAYFWLRHMRSALFAALPITCDASKSLSIRWNDLVIGCLAAIVGIMTHLFVDGFTHVDGFMVDRWSLLRVEWEVSGQTIPVWHFLQLFLTVIGLVVIGVYFFRSTQWKYVRFWKMSIYAKAFWMRSLVFSLIVGVIISFLRWPFASFAMVSVVMMTSVGVGMTVASLRNKTQ